MSMSVDGLVSGMDTTSIISQLMATEAAPQNALKTKLSATQSHASAYRTVNTTILAVTSLVSTQSVVSNSQWNSLTADATTQEPSWPIQILDPADGSVRGTVNLAAGASLNDAIAAINGANLGVKAAALNLGGNKYRLQLTSATSGATGGFIVKSATETYPATAGTAFLQTSPATDATLDLGGGLVATSSSNTFADLLPGLSVTVSKIDPAPVSISVSMDTDSVATKVQTLVDAVNAALTTVKTYTNNDKGSTAALKGDYNLTSLTGIAGRLFDVAKSASDSTTGSIVALAKGKDSIATDLTKRIEAWDLRLVKRKEMLTRQFTAMETALSSLKNQSTWLAGQINSLPTS